MKFRNGFISNSSSSSFLITEDKIEDLKAIKDVIERFFEDYENKTSEYFDFTCYDGKEEVELSTETYDRGERLLYEIFSSVIY